MANSNDADKIANILLKTSAEHGLSRKFEHEWLVSLLAVDLGTNNMKRVKQLKDDVMNERLHPQDALSGIIKEWFVKNGKNASLEKLLALISSNGFENFADAIIQQCNADDLKQDEGSSSYYISPEDKALSNPVILSNIFAKLKCSDQQQFRLVNTLWRNVTIAKFRESTMITLRVNGIDKLGKGLKQFLQLLPGGKHESFQISQVPFRRFRLFWEWRRERLDTRLEDLQLLDKFWEFCSPKIEQIDIGCFWSTELFFDNLKWILVAGERSELKTLRIYFTKSTDDLSVMTNLAKSQKILSVANKLTHLEIDKGGFDELPVSTDMFRELFKIIPNLKKLSVDGGGFENALRALATPLAAESPSQRFIQLESLSFHEEDNEQTILPLTLDYLKTARPMLKELSLSCCVIKTNTIMKPPYHFHQILSQCFNTITKLNVTLEMNIQNKADAWITEFSRRLFPELQELSLRIHEYHEKSLNTKFDFGAFTGMPKLKIFNCKLIYEPGRGADLTDEDLKFRGRNVEWMRDYTSNDHEDYEKLKMDNLEEFKFRLFRNFGGSSLRKLANWTKNLKRLSLPLTINNSEEILQLSLDLWPKLQEFKCMRGSRVPKDVIERYQQMFTIGEIPCKIVDEW